MNQPKSQEIKLFRLNFFSINNFVAHQVYGSFSLHFPNNKNDFHDLQYIFHLSNIFWP